MQAAAEDIKKLGAYLSNLIAFAGELEKIGSLEQVSKEIDNRVQSLRSQENEARLDLEVAEKDLAEVNAELKAFVESTKKNNDLLIQEAKLKSQAIIDGAKAEANEIVAASKLQKESLIQELHYLKEERSIARAETAEVKAKLDTLKSELADLKAKLGV
jgi:chromosome segregation ATPase